MLTDAFTSIRQGLYIRFRDMSGGSQKYNIITIMNPAAQSHIVANLKKYTKYEFFVAPFYKTVEGQPSNSKVVQTFEDGKFMLKVFSKPLPHNGIHSVALVVVAERSVKELNLKIFDCLLFFYILHFHLYSTK